MATTGNQIRKKGNPLSLRQLIATNQETFYKKILDSPGETRFLLDDQLRVAWFNKPAQNLYQKLAGKRLTHLASMTDLLKPSELEQFFGYIAQVYSGKSFRFDLKLGKGNNHWYNIALHPFSLNEKDISGVYTVVREVARPKDNSKNHPEAQIEHQKEISRLILKAEEEERSRLGKELHDNINQILAAIKIQLSHCLDNYSKGRPIIEKSHAHLREVMEEIKKLSHHLVAPGFSDSSLTLELKRLAETYQKSFTVVIDHSHFREDSITLNLKEVLFRIIQEQLYNIFKHAKASKVHIKLDRKAETIRLKIEDNGTGLDSPNKRNSFGITNIFSRAELEGGRAQIKEVKGSGRCLLVTIPVDGR